MIPRTHGALSAPAEEPRSPDPHLLGLRLRAVEGQKLGQISPRGHHAILGRAGATLQLIVIEWGRSHLGYQLDKASMLMGVAALGTVVGITSWPGAFPLRRALAVLPVGAMMGRRRC